VHHIFWDFKKLSQCICANREVLPKADALANCGVTDQSRLVIGGVVVSDISKMTNEILKDIGSYNPKKLEHEVVAVAKKNGQRRSQHQNLLA
jgi:hypothetical protein